VTKPISPELRRQLRNEEDELLLERVRIVIAIVLGSLPLYVVADFYVRPLIFWPLQLVKLVACGIVLLIWKATRQPQLRRHARVVALILVAAVCGTSAASANLTGESTSHAFLAVMATLFGSTLAPWGVLAQAVAVLIVAATVLWNVVSITGSLGGFLQYPAVIVCVTWGVSIYVAWLLEHNRLALAQENHERARAETEVREEAATSAALARVGAELIAAVSSPDLLSRLAQLTTEVLGCDCSWTVMRKAETGSFVVTARHGFSPEQEASIDLVVIPQAAIQAVLEQLESGEPMLVNPGDLAGSPVARLTEQYGVTRRMHVGLRRGGRLVG